MYKAIGFDWGGVLVHSKPIMPGIAEIINIPLSQLRPHYYKNNMLAGVESMSYEDLWAKIISDFGRSDKLQEVLAYMHTQQTFELNHEMVELVDLLKAQGYKTGLLSNNTRENGEKIRKSGLDKHFDAFLISAEIGYQKPEKDAFNLLIKELEVLPQELIFIDDSTGSLSQASQIGYQPILFTGIEDLKTELIKLKVIQ